MDEDPVSTVANEAGSTLLHTAHPDKAYLMYAVWFQTDRGREKYGQYLEAASPIAQKYGAKRVQSLIPVEAIHGDFEPDYLFMIEWPSVDKYYEFLKDVQYRAIAPILSEATKKTVVLHLKGHH